LKRNNQPEITSVIRVFYGNREKKIKKIKTITIGDFGQIYRIKKAPLSAKKEAHVFEYETSTI